MARSRKPAANARRAEAELESREHATQGHSEFELRDDVVETALQTGEYDGLLQDYFGPENYAELRQLAREAAARGVRGGPRVLILPGIMGSKIGIKNTFAFFDDVFWFDPLAVGRGRLADLSLIPKSKKKLEPVGVILLAYLKIKLRLRAAGYDADFHPFDWRLSIAELGKQLKGRLDEEGPDTSVVAHSMGGLVARWALGAGKAKIKRLVMLGTPNYGSFAPVLALRGVYPVVKKLAFIDTQHSVEDLACKVFNTFNGLTELLPARERFNTVDLYDVDNWPDPRCGLRPRQEILDTVDDVRDGLAPADAETYLIAGVDRKTVVSMRLGSAPSEGFQFETSNDGDGTVPLSLALLPNAKTYFVAESHGSLANNRVVGEAVVDLLDRGETRRLSERHEASRSSAEVVSEETLRQTEPYPARRGQVLSQQELRELLDEVASPNARAEDAVAPARVDAKGAPVQIRPGYRHRFDRVVVGRRRQHRIDLRFALGSITEADTRALALGIFRDVAPSGAAAAVDRRLDGAITDVTQRRMFSGNVGEIFMLPTGRHSLAVDTIAFVGLGPFDRFTDEVLQVAAENLLRTLVSTRVEELATVVYGSGSGGRPEDGLRNLLTGFFRGLVDADRDHHFRRIVICERDPERYIALKEELYRLSSTELCQNVEITFDEVELKPELVPAAAPTRALRRGKDPLYLIVRQERNVGGRIDVRSSVLTAGSKATVVTGVTRVQESELDRWRTRAARQRTSDFSEVGLALSKLLLAPEIREVMPRFQDHHLVVVHDAPMSRVPWETLAFKGSDEKNWFPAGESGLTHRYAADNLSIAKWLEERLEDGTFTMLLVVNPTGDLDGAEKEGKRIRRLFETRPGSRIDVLWGDQATHPALRSAFASARYDVIHYAGHAFFDEASPEQSGLICHGGVPLTGADLAGVGNLPTLVFFNACESARVRGGTRGAKGRGKVAERTAKTVSAARAESDRAITANLDKVVGLGEAFMRGGVANFLGTYWPVGDDAAAAFAQAFYDRVLMGQSLGEALQAARKVVRDDVDSKDWADYIFYGNPDFVLKEALRAGDA